MKLYRIIIPVNDIDLAIRFYSEIIGTEGTRVSTGRHYFKIGEMVVACYDPIADGDEQGSWHFHENQYLYFAVSDLTNCREKVIKFGISHITEIKDMPWGETLFYTQDPFGTPICFVEEKTVFTG